MCLRIMSVVEASDMVFTLQCTTARTTEELCINFHKTLRRCLNVLLLFLQVLVLLFSYLYSFVSLTSMEAGLFKFVKNHVKTYCEIFISQHFVTLYECVWIWSYICWDSHKCRILFLPVNRMVALIVSTGKYQQWLVKAVTSSRL
jgi:hypothetical protein